MPQAMEPRSEAERAEWAEIDRRARMMPRYVAVAGTSQKMLDDAGAGKDVCDSCGASGPKFRCSSCQGVRYCSRECQAYAWKKGGHKQQCKEIQVMTHEQTQRKNILELVSAKKDILRMPIEELRSELAWYKDELQFERAFYEQVFGVDPSITSKEDDATALVGMLKEARSYYATNMILQDAAGTSTFWSPKARRGGVPTRVLKRSRILPTSSSWRYLFVFHGLIMLTSPRYASVGTRPCTIPTFGELGRPAP